MVSSKVIIEIRFDKPKISRSVLEELVMEFAEKKGELLDPLRKIDPKVNIRIWYERAGSERNVELPSFMKLFGKRRD